MAYRPEAWLSLAAMPGGAVLLSVQGCWTGVGGRHGIVVDCCDDCSETFPYQASDAICNRNLDGDDAR